MDERRLPAATRDAVDRAYGFAVPDTFRRLLELLSDDAGSVPGDADSLFMAATGLMLADDSDRTPGTPPEFRVIGRTGMDDITCGCVIHDARVAAEPPLAMFNPNDVRGDYLGLDARRGLGTLIGMNLHQRHHDDDPRLPRIREIIQQLGFNPDELPDEQPLGLRPRMPPGWKLAMTADGLGVAGRIEQFAPDQAFDTDPESFERLALEEFLSPARDALARGFAATALWHLRNAFSFHALEATPAALKSLMKQAYAALDRDFLIAHQD